MSPLGAIALLLLPTAHASTSEAVATFNLGLLSVFGEYTVPQAEVRRAAMPAALAAYLEGSRPAPMVFQECYTREDRALIAEIGRVSGYRTIDARSWTAARTGLVALVRGDLDIVDQGFTALPNDMFRIAAYGRGLLWFRLRLGSGRTLLVTDTHLTPTQGGRLARRREAQVEAVLQALADRDGPFHCLDLPDACAAVMAGDYNLSPGWDFRHTRQPPDAETRAELERRFAEDAGLYQQLRDVAVHEAAVEQTWTLDPQNPVWEGHDLNEGLPASRPDLAFVLGGATLSHARIVLDAPVAAGGYPLSSHYGLEVGVVLGAR